MICTAPTFYHGSTVGWLHLSGFRKSNFSYGEFSKPHNFIFLCTQREGGESAACKAHVKVHDRHNNSPPLIKYYYENTQYLIDRYVYQVNIKDDADVLNFHSEKLNKTDLARVIRAISLSKASKFSQIIESCLSYIFLRLNPKDWRNRLDTTFENRGEMVHALGKAGFHMIQNFERDGDGQQYGEVWVLPMNKVAHAAILQPTTYKLV